MVNTSAKHVTGRWVKIHGRLEMRWKAVSTTECVVASFAAPPVSPPFFRREAA